MIRYTTKAIPTYTCDICGRENRGHADAVMVYYGLVVTVPDSGTMNRVKLTTDLPACEKHICRFCFNSLRQDLETIHTKVEATGETEDAHDRPPEASEHRPS